MAGSIGDELREVELARAFADGDEEALRAAFENHGPQVHALVRWAGVEGDPRSVTVDAFARAWRQRAELDPERQSLPGHVLAATRAVLLDAGPGLDDQALVRQCNRLLVADCLHQLPAPADEMTELAVFEGLAPADVAARCGVPVGAARSEVARGLQRLRRRLIEPADARVPDAELTAHLALLMADLAPDDRQPPSPPRGSWKLLRRAVVDEMQGSADDPADVVADPGAASDADAGSTAADQREPGASVGVAGVDGDAGPSDADGREPGPAVGDADPPVADVVGDRAAIADGDGDGDPPDADLREPGPAVGDASVFALSTDRDDDALPLAWLAAAVAAIVATVLVLAQLVG